MTTTPGRAPAGMRVGDYTLLARIGEGGMGVVHLARSPRGDRVALKVLRPHVVGDQEARERLAREVASLGRVRSPRIAEIVDADPWGPVPFVATRYVPGLNLHDHVAEEGPLRGPDLLHFAHSLAEALQAVHRVGVLHRDIKPTNVLMEGRHPVLIDFGLARLADDERITRTGFLLGTPGYLAPEVLHGDEPTAASDVHSWAATVAFAGLGRPPFGRGPAMAVMDRVRRGEHDLAGLGPEVLGPVLAALEPDPQDRPSLRSLAATLGGAPAAERAAGHRSAPEPTMTMPLAAMPGPGAVGPATRETEPAGATMEPTNRPYQEPPPPPQRPQSGGHPIGSRTSWPVRLGRSALGVALVWLVAAATAAGPWLLLAVCATAVVLLRSVSLSSTAATVRRDRRGPKWYDGVLDVVSAPWHFLVSLPLSVLLVAWGAMLGASVALLLLALGVGEVLLLAVAGAVFGVAVWTGPGSSRVRTPVTGLGRPLADAILPWSLAMLALVGVGSLLLAIASGGIAWTPFDRAPWGGDSWLGRLR